MNLEDRLRASFSDHDNEAPTPDSLPARPWLAPPGQVPRSTPRRGRRIPFAWAASTAVLVGLTAAVVLAFSNNDADTPSLSSGPGTDRPTGSASEVRPARAGICLTTPAPIAAASRQMVPGSPATVVICPNGPTRPAVETKPPQALIDALNSLPTSRRTDATCLARDQNALPARNTYELHFLDTNGSPIVTVNVLPSCEPGVNNGQLTADSANTILPLIPTAGP